MSLYFSAMFHFLISIVIVNFLLKTFLHYSLSAIRLSQSLHTINILILWIRFIDGKWKSISFSMKAFAACCRYCNFLFSEPFQMNCSSHYLLHPSICLFASVSFDWSWVGWHLDLMIVWFWLHELYYSVVNMIREILIELPMANRCQLSLSYQQWH